LLLGLFGSLGAGVGGENVAEALLKTGEILAAESAL